MQKRKNLINKNQNQKDIINKIEFDLVNMKAGKKRNKLYIK